MHCHPAGPKAPKHENTKDEHRNGDQRDDHHLKKAPAWRTLRLRGGVQLTDLAQHRIQLGMGLGQVLLVNCRFRLRRSHGQSAERPMGEPTVWSASRSRSVARPSQSEPAAMAHQVSTTSAARPKNQPTGPKGSLCRPLASHQ